MDVPGIRWRANQAVQFPHTAGAPQLLRDTGRFRLTTACFVSWIKILFLSWVCTASSALDFCQ